MILFRYRKKMMLDWRSLTNEEMSNLLSTQNTQHPNFQLSSPTGMSTWVTVVKCPTQLSSTNVPPGPVSIISSTLPTKTSHWSVLPFECSVVQLQYFGPTCVHIKESTEEESQIQMSNRVLQPRSPQSGSAVQLTIPLQCLNMDMCNCHCPAPGHFMLVFSPSHLDVLLKCLLMRLSMKQPEETSHWKCLHSWTDGQLFVKKKKTIQTHKETQKNTGAFLSFPHHRREM